VLIALPNCQGRVSPVFDVAARLLVVDLKNSSEPKSREVVLFEHTSEGIVRNLHELKIKVLICGAISVGLKQALQQVGIRVVAEVCGDIEGVLAAYLSGQLCSPEFKMPGCCGRRWSLDAKRRTEKNASRVQRPE